ncbi:hypothetical protein Tco_1575837 [Tanacetum coccineum]
MSTDIVKLDLFNGGSFKRWQKKPWLHPVNVSSSEMTISFDVATSSMLCRIHSWTYIKIIPVLGNFGKLSRNASARKTQQVIGNLMYAMTCIRPDIAFAIGRLSRHTNSLGKEHWDAVNRVFKYLKKTMDYGLEYSGDPSVLEGYIDASWITNQEGYIVLSYVNNLDKVHLSECGSEAASYKLKGLALKHSEKPRYRPKASFNGSEQSGLNEREEGYA